MPSLAVIEATGQEYNGMPFSLRDLVEMAKDLHAVDDPYTLFAICGEIKAGGYASGIILEHNTETNGMRTAAANGAPREKLKALRNDRIDLVANILRNQDNGVEENANDARRVMLQHQLPMVGEAYRAPLKRVVMRLPISAYEQVNPMLGDYEAEEYQLLNPHKILTEMGQDGEGIMGLVNTSNLSSAQGVGTAAGAAAGSALGPIGTAAGGVLGGILGGALGGFTGGATDQEIKQLPSWAQASGKRHNSQWVKNVIAHFIGESDAKVAFDWVKFLAKWPGTNMNFLKGASEDETDDKVIDWLYNATPWGKPLIGTTTENILANIAARAVDNNGNQGAAAKAFLAQYGTSSGSSSSPTTGGTLPSDFNEAVYIKMWPDLASVKAAHPEFSGSGHYLQYGKNENRAYYPGGPGRQPDGTTVAAGAGKGTKGGTNPSGQSGSTGFSTTGVVVAAAALGIGVFALNRPQAHRKF